MADFDDQDDDWLMAAVDTKAFTENAPGLHTIHVCIINFFAFYNPNIRKSKCVTSVQI